jgi:hypothetical protein
MRQQFIYFTVMAAGFFGYLHRFIMPLYIIIAVQLPYQLFTHGYIQVPIGLPLLYTYMHQRIAYFIHHPHYMVLAVVYAVAGFAIIAYRLAQVVAVQHSAGQFIAVFVYASCYCYYKRFCIPRFPKLYNHAPFAGASVGGGSHQVQLVYAIQTNHPVSL